MCWTLVKFIIMFYILGPSKIASIPMDLPPPHLRKIIVFSIFKKLIVFVRINTSR